MSNYSTDSNYLSSKEAGKLLGYTHDYISKLCCEGKMSGKQQGRAWYVLKEEVIDFETRHQAEQTQKKAKLSKSFSKMRSNHDLGRVSNVASQAKRVIEEVKKEDFVQTPEPEVTQNPSSTNRLRFTLPKKLTAAGVLAFVLLISSFLNAPASLPTAQNNSQTKVSQTASIQTGLGQIKNSGSQDTSVNSNLISNIDRGIATVIDAQSELFLKTANMYSFVQYLADGYWQLAETTIYLSSNVYSFLDTVSDSYLTVYVLQGQAVYNSFGAVKQFGDGVLTTYEMSGQLVWIGTQNTLNAYDSILNSNESAYFVYSTVSSFKSDLNEGFNFYSQKAPQALASAIWTNIGGGLMHVTNNIQSNLSYISNGLSEMAQNTTALISNSLSFDLFSPEEPVRKIEIR